MMKTKSCVDEECPVSMSEYFTKSQWQRLFVFLLILLGISTYHINSLRELRCILGSSDIDKIQEKIEKATAQLKTLQQQHAYITERLKYTRKVQGPVLEGEKSRRRIMFLTKEIWNNIQNNLRKFNETNQRKQVNITLHEMADRKRALLSELWKLPEVDGFQKWRHNEAGSVGDLIQRRLNYLQNPPNCQKAKKILCESDGCGLGCQQHHLVYCLIYAYASQRTLVLKSFDWIFLVENKVQSLVFRPFSKTCTGIYRDNVLPWSAATLNAKVVSLPILRFLNEPVFPYFLPSYIPKDLARRISRFNADPPAWWAGQMLKFILKPQKEAQKIIRNALLGIDFKSPTVGIHIRRTDKIEGEAESHDIKEYMAQAEDYFEQLEQYHTLDERRIYLATDEPRVLEQAIKMYPQYKFYTNITRVKLAGKNNRLSPEAVAGTLVDVHMLAICDFVVCTFSSNIGRMIFELVQTYRLDAYASVSSLDMNYFFTVAEPHFRVAVMHNKGEMQRPGTVPFKVGDMLMLDDKSITSQATGVTTHQHGRIPWYKTVANYPVHPFPKYEEVPVYTDKRQP